MGEPHRQLGLNDFVEERLLKIRELKEGVAVAIAGDVQLAQEIVDFMQDNIGSLEEVTDVLPTVEASFGPFDPARGVEILLIHGKENGECVITRWDTDSGRRDAAEWAYIGSLAPEQARTIADHVLRIGANQPPSSKEALLLAAIAHVLLCSQHADLIAQHIGGVVYGLRVQRGKSIWPDDLIIVHHRDDLALVDGRIAVHAREGSVYVHSTYQGVVAGLFVNKHERVHTDDIRDMWDQRWWPYLKDYLSKHFTTCTRWLFINRDRQVALVFVNHGRPEQASNHIRFMRKEGNDIVPVVGDELFEMLLRTAKSDAPEVRVVDVIVPGEPLPDGIVTTQ